MSREPIGTLLLLNINMIEPGAGGSLNNFSYVDNDPISKIDPPGLIGQKTEAECYAQFRRRMASLITEAGECLAGSAPYIGEDILITIVGCAIASLLCGPGWGVCMTMCCGIAGISSSLITAIMFAESCLKGVAQLGKLYKKELDLCLECARI